MEGTTITATPEKADLRDGRARQPAQIRMRGWIQVAKRSWKRAKANQVPLLAAGVAFYAFLAVFPALIAIVSIYGLFADTSKIPNQLSSLTTALPDEASKVLNDQVTTLTARPSTLGIGLVVSVVIALWSASAAVSNLLTAIDVAYDEEDKRGFIKKRLLSLGLTLAAIVFMVIMLGNRRRLAAAAESNIRYWDPALGVPDPRLVGACPTGCRSAGGALSHRTAPQCSANALGLGRCRCGNRNLAARLDRVLDLFIHRRQLCQDLRRLRRNRRAAPVAMAEHVRDLVRRGDRRRGRGRAIDNRRLRSWRGVATNPTSVGTFNLDYLLGLGVVANPSRHFWKGNDHHDHAATRRCAGWQSRTTQ